MKITEPFKVPALEGDSPRCGRQTLHAPNAKLSAPLTLKAFANSSPGLRFGNPGNSAFQFFEDATLKGLRRRPPNRKARRNSFRVATNLLGASSEPRVSKQTLPPRAGCPRGDPGLAGISRRLQRKS